MPAVERSRPRVGRYAIAAAIALLLLPASPGWAQEGSADAAPGAWAGEVTASRLKLRAGPGEAYQTVVTLEQGERFIVLGPHANSPDWLKVELPQGYEAWVFGELLEEPADGMARVSGSRVLVRPRATTRYHQLMGRLENGEPVRVVDRKTTEEGLWYRIVVPRRFPLFAHRSFVKNLGADLVPTVETEAERRTTAPEDEAADDAGTAEPAAGPAQDAPDATVEATEADRRYAEIERTVRARMAAVETSAEIEPLRRRLDAVDTQGLSRDNQEKRYTLLTELVAAERRLAREEFAEAEQQVLERLERRLAEIQAEYQRRLERIRERTDEPERPRYDAVGIVSYRPDVFGRTPSFRLVEAGKMRYFLIATDFELQRFEGKRVGIVGLVDAESGTGHQTLIVKRIEILGEE